MCHFLVYYTYLSILTIAAQVLFRRYVRKYCKVCSKYPDVYLLFHTLWNTIPGLPQDNSIIKKVKIQMVITSKCVCPPSAVSTHFHVTEGKM